MMKKTTIMIAFFVLFASNAWAVQEGQATATKKSPAKSKPSVDCSTIDDATLAANVKDKLSNTASLKDYTFNVTAKNGAVTLTGSVKKATNKGLATRQAKRVPCVKSVDNQISIEGKPAAEMKKP